MGLLMGHCHLKGYLLTMGLIDSPGCELKVWDCWILEFEQKVQNG